MEWADEPPPLILLYQIGVGCIRGAKGGGVGVSGWGKERFRDEVCGGKARRGLVDHVNDSK